MMNSRPPRDGESGGAGGTHQEVQVGTSTPDDTRQAADCNPEPDIVEIALRPGTKLHRVYNALLKESLNRFEAERIGDHCLHSTVSRLQEYGITVARHHEKVPTQWGSPVTVCRYWIPS